MPAAIGRSFVIKKGAAAIAGVQTKSATYNGEGVDITSDDDAGYQTWLDETGQFAIEISFDGVSKDAILRDLALDGSSRLLTDITLEWDDGATLAGDFYFPTYEENGTYNDAVKFSGSLSSSGTWTFTPAP